VILLDDLLTNGGSLLVEGRMTTPSNPRPLATRYECALESRVSQSRVGARVVSRAALLPFPATGKVFPFVDRDHLSFDCLSGDDLVLMSSVHGMASLSSPSESEFLSS
jgi:hypothetical protein